MLTHGAAAQDAVPDLKGTWTGKGKSIVFGTNAHHPGKAAAMSGPPRVRDIEVTYVVEGQDGRLVWGRASTAVADQKRAVCLGDCERQQSIVIGADMDGYYRITIDRSPTAWRSATRTTRRGRAAPSSRAATW